jgi:hypothetical protein
MDYPTASRAVCMLHEECNKSLLPTTYSVAPRLTYSPPTLTLDPTLLLGQLTWAFKAVAHNLKWHAAGLRSFLLEINLQNIATSVIFCCCFFFLVEIS